MLGKSIVLHESPAGGGGGRWGTPSTQRSTRTIATAAIWSSHPCQPPLLFDPCVAVLFLSPSSVATIPLPLRTPPPPILKCLRDPESEEEQYLRKAATQAASAAPRASGLPKKVFGWPRPWVNGLGVPTVTCNASALDVHQVQWAVAVAHWHLHATESTCSGAFKGTSPVDVAAFQVFGGHP